MSFTIDSNGFLPSGLHVITNKRKKEHSAFDVVENSNTHQIYLVESPDEDDEYIPFSGGYQDSTMSSAPSVDLSVVTTTPDHQLQENNGEDDDDDDDEDYEDLQYKRKIKETLIQQEKAEFEKK